MKFFDKKSISNNNSHFFNDTILSYRKTLLKLISNIAPATEVEDIVQDAYVKIYQIKCDNKPINYPKAMLYKIAKNLAYDFNKKAHVRLSESIEDEIDYGISELDDTYQQVLSNDEFSQFCDAVRHLPVQCRKIFVMRKIYGFTQQEIATELDLSLHTIGSQIAIGMRKCNKYLKKSLNDKQRASVKEFTGLKARSNK